MKHALFIFFVFGLVFAEVSVAKPKCIDPSYESYRAKLLGYGKRKGAATWLHDLKGKIVGALAKTGLTRTLFGINTDVFNEIRSEIELVVKEEKKLDVGVGMGFTTTPSMEFLDRLVGNQGGAKNFGSNCADKLYYYSRSIAKAANKCSDYQKNITKKGLTPEKSKIELFQRHFNTATQKYGYGESCLYLAQFSLAFLCSLPENRANSKCSKLPIDNMLKKVLNKSKQEVYTYFRDQENKTGECRPQKDFQIRVLANVVEHFSGTKLLGPKNKKSDLIPYRLEAETCIGDLKARLKRSDHLKSKNVPKKKAVL